MRQLLIFIYFVQWVAIQPMKSQGVSNLETGTIVELECVQSNLTGTFVSASMERMENNTERVLIHRSANNGISWSLIDSMPPYEGDMYNGDPVVASDSLGNFYLVFMRIRNNQDPTLIVMDLELFASQDDGVTWDFVSSPNFSDHVADYPQLISSNNGELNLVYTHILGFPFVDAALLAFKSSDDGGVTWSSQYVGDENIRRIGPDVIRGFDGTLLISAGRMESSLVDVYTSDNSGGTWSQADSFLIPNGEIAHITKPVANSLHPHYGIISHRPHMENTPIYYHALVDGNQVTQQIDNGAYAQGYMTNDGIIHLVYNKREGNNLKINYTYSEDGGVIFTNPVALYSASFSNSASGEYQSLVLGNDEIFYLTFCDWSDISSAKMLSFPPLISLSTSELTNEIIKISPNPTNGIFSLQLEDNSEIEYLTLFDMNGKSVFQHDLPRNESLIDISFLDNGMYIISCQVGRKVVVSRLIKQTM